MKTYIFEKYVNKKKRSKTMNPNENEIFTDFCIKALGGFFITMVFVVGGRYFMEYKVLKMVDRLGEKAIKEGAPLTVNIFRKGE